MVPFPENKIHEDLTSERNLRQIMNLIKTIHKIYNGQNLDYQAVVESFPWKHLLFIEIKRMYGIQWKTLDDCVKTV